MLVMGVFGLWRCLSVVRAVCLFVLFCFVFLVQASRGSALVASVALLLFCNFMS